MNKTETQENKVNSKKENEMKGMPKNIKTKERVTSWSTTKLNGVEFINVILAGWTPGMLVVDKHGTLDYHCVSLDDGRMIPSKDLILPDALAMEVAQIHLDAIGASIREDMYDEGVLVENPELRIWANTGKLDVATINVPELLKDLEEYDPDGSVVEPETIATLKSLFSRMVKLASRIRKDNPNNIR